MGCEVERLFILGRAWRPGKGLALKRHVPTMPDVRKYEGAVRRWIFVVYEPSSTKQTETKNARIYIFNKVPSKF